MTFLDPANPMPRAGSIASHLARLGRIATRPAGRLIGDEDRARKALGNDPMMPPAFLAGASLEDLARIALG